MGVPAFLVLGAGAWGTALASVLAAGGRRVLLWGRDAAALRALEATRENARYLPGIRLPDSLGIVEALAEIPAHCTQAVLATPCQTTREICRLLAATAPQVRGIVCAAKGLERATGRLVHEVVREELGADVDVAVLSGPNFAREVAERRPAAVTIAADRTEFGAALLAAFHTAFFRPYLSEDLVGVAVGGSVKNALAIAAGIGDGLRLGANSRAALITRGLAEIARLGVALGARAETFMGLSGLGDLVLTCTDDLSRNRRFGLALGRGTSPEVAAADIGLVEGAATAPAVAALGARLRVEVPIVEQVAAVLAGHTTPAAAVAALMAREPRAEDRAWRR
ncbi:MAG TPA: NAD(P)H-dependent glycerol-3-phosphate dehydrogenase [Gammaproteobacteria bacterium]|nr:NAD(P)H-dependent glycerol-3-phosphate dehydrogenase [Gammaproteobacteria bacterium]